MTKHVNWVGMLMGPQGSTMKMLQTDFRCRFKFFGKGSNKNGPDEVFFACLVYLMNKISTAFRLLMHSGIYFLQCLAQKTNGNFFRKFSILGENV
jgi:hypothetical protein